MMMHDSPEGHPVDSQDLPPLETPRLLPGVRAIANQYQTFILDLWGVVHDGAAAFPHSVETMRRMHDAGCKVMLLSNAPRRAHVLIDQMERFGIARHLYGAVLSSGEAVRRDLTTRADPACAALGTACYHLGPERDRSLFEDVPLRLTETIEDAEFIVNTGPLEGDDDIAVYETLLGIGIRRKMPMVCANPDKIVLRQGRPIMCAGTLADHYRALGGQVLMRGKPDAAIYHLCLETMGADPLSTVVIGDSLETDMRGAMAAGLNGIWVTGGIHAKEVKGAYGKPADPALIAALCHRHKLRPTALLSGFIW